MSQVAFGPGDRAAGWVLIIAPVDDGHALTVARVVAKIHRVRAVIWDGTDFPSTDSMTLRRDADSGALEILSGVSLGDFARCLCVWWRRPGRFKLGAALTDTRIRDYCHAECVTFFKSALLATGVPIVNDPFAELAARKPLQLQFAAACGLAIPATVMTNNPERVRDFWQDHGGNCIYKTFTPPSWRMAETRVMSEADLKNLDALRHAPVIVQELVPKLRDVRVTIIDGRCFAGSVNTSRPEASLDWRMDVAAQWAEHSLPEPVMARLVELLRWLGLIYGAVDLRQKPDGQYVFLEVNPSGQYLFVEVETGQPMTLELASLLVNARSRIRTSRRSVMVDDPDVSLAMLDDPEASRLTGTVGEG
jgi:glutathione synthase/RimK-type ligase-like ATP-grasp enzyme